MVLVLGVWLHHCTVTLGKELNFLTCSIKRVKVVLPRSYCENYNRMYVKCSAQYQYLASAEQRFLLWNVL